MEPVALPQEKVERMVRCLAARQEILFAYLHGSSLCSTQPGDVDLAVYLTEPAFNALDQEHRLTLGFAIPLEMTIEEAISFPVDLQVLNRAPLAFRCRVADEGVVLLDRDPDYREDYELLTRKEYWEFRPKLDAYLQEALGIS
ncbi:MAG: nucleotidyltransferase domain-containing protein [bacterium]